VNVKRFQALYLGLPIEDFFDNFLFVLRQILKPDFFVENLAQHHLRLVALHPLHPWLSNATSLQLLQILHPLLSH
jgi:hypothetical protein